MNFMPKTSAAAQRKAVPYLYLTALCSLLFIATCAFTISFVAPNWSPVFAQKKSRPKAKKKARPCRNCFSVNFDNVDMKDWLKTMANLIQRNILVDDSIQGKITVISYEKVPESRALSFMKQVLEIKGFGIIEEPNLIKIVRLKQAGEAALPGDKPVSVKSSGVISRVVLLPPELDANEVTNIFKSVAGPNVSIVPYRPTNTIVVTGFARNVLRIMGISKKLVETIQSSERSSISAAVHIYHARHITAESLSKVLTKLDAPQVPEVKSSKKGPKSNTNKKIRAVAHKESNTIVVTATQGEWLGIENIIRKLDTPRTQILLEVLITEISSNDRNDFGVDWRSLGPEGHAQFNTGLAAESNILSFDSDASADTIINPSRNTLNGFSLGFLGSQGDLLGILRANIRRENFNVLSSPQVLALNNQEAEINVGQDVPVRTRAQISAEGGTSTDSFEYRPAGIKLKITPQINPSGQITLNFFAEISNIQGQESAAAIGTNPTFSKRNVKTHVTVKNKQTIVLGGLISSQKTKTITKIPLLGDIPLLGYLFRRSIDVVARSNLMIFMTPHMLENRTAADAMTDWKRREQEKSLQKIHNRIIVWPEKRIGK